MADSSRPSARKLAASAVAGVRAFLRRERSTLQGVVECVGFLCIVGAGFAVATALGLLMLGIYLVLVGNLGGE